MRARLSRSLVNVLSLNERPVGSQASAAFILAAMCLCSCTRSNRGQDQADEPPTLPVSSSETPIPPTEMISAAQMRERLGVGLEVEFERSGLKYIAANLAQSGAKTLEPLAGQPLRQLDIAATSIADLAPLKGMPLRSLDASETMVSSLQVIATLPLLEELYLEKAQVSDLTPLREHSLKKLWLSHCPVTDLRALSGRQFEELNLCNIPCSDFSPLADCSIGTLWLRETAFNDLKPLADQSLISLDLQGTQVDDLSILQDMNSLQRLNIAKTNVSDLRPLAGLKLTRLIFSSEKIKEGLDVVRAMKSLRELDVSFEGNSPAMTPSEFWERFDRMNSTHETPP